MMSTPIRGQNGTAVALPGSEIDLFSEGGLQIMSALMGNPCTTMQLSMQLKLNRARVQFVVDRLMQQNLVHVFKEVEEPDRIEVYYTAAVKDITLALNGDSSHNAQLLGAQIILDSLREDALGALANNQLGRVVFLKLVQCHMSLAKAKAFAEKLEKLANEFNDAEEDSAEQVFALALTFYPVIDLSKLPEDSHEFSAV